MLCTCTYTVPSHRHVGFRSSLCLVDLVTSTCDSKSGYYAVNSSMGSTNSVPAFQHCVVLHNTQHYRPIHCRHTKVRKPECRCCLFAFGMDISLGQQDDSNACVTFAHCMMPGGYTLHQADYCMCSSLILAGREGGRQYLEKPQDSFCHAAWWRMPLASSHGACRVANRQKAMVLAVWQRCKREG